ncbi:MAG: hypothetical protein L0287_06645 [Anaerolineae bacterium]|nr:hypothetical protein [Anaerolineae bacterium]
MRYSDQFLSEADPENLLNLVQRQKQDIEALRQSVLKLERLSGIAKEIGELDFRAFDSTGKLRVVMSAVDLFNELGVHAHLVGRNASGVVQFYLSADDGKIYGGGGGVMIDQTGIVFANSAGILHFRNAAGASNMRLVANSSDQLILQQENVGKPIRLIVYHTNGATPSVYWQEDPGNVNVSQFNVEKGTAGGKINIGSGLVLWASRDGVETVFNEDSFDIDHRFEGATDAYLWKLDAGTDRVGVGVAAPGYKLDVNGDVNVASGSNFKTNGSNVVSAKQNLFLHGLNQTVPASSTYFMPLTIVAGLSSTAINVKFGADCNLAGLRLKTNTAQPASGTLVVTVQKNNVDTAITFTVPISGAAGEYSNLANTVSFVTGDLAQIKLVNNATSDSANISNGSLLLTFT